MYPSPVNDRWIAGGLLLKTQQNLFELLDPNPASCTGLYGAVSVDERPEREAAATVGREH